MKSIAQMLSKEGDYEILSQVLAGLRTASHIHQTHHWQTHGPTFYEDHLLFERLYNKGQGDIDALAEKTIGLGHFSLVEAHDQITAMSEMCAALCQEIEGSDPEGMVLKSMAAERKLLELLSQALDSLEENGSLTPGLSNLLEDIADRREGFVYLLKQRALK